MSSKKIIPTKQNMFHHDEERSPFTSIGKTKHLEDNPMKDVISRRKDAFKFLSVLFKIDHEDSNVIKNEHI